MSLLSMHRKHGTTTMTKSRLLLLISSRLSVSLGFAGVVLLICAIQLFGSFSIAVVSSSPSLSLSLPSSSLSSFVAADLDGTATTSGLVINPIHQAQTPKSNNLDSQRNETNPRALGNENKNDDKKRKAQQKVTELAVATVELALAKSQSHSNNNSNSNSNSNDTSSGGGSGSSVGLVPSLSCFEPNLTHTWQLVQKYKHRPMERPVFNMGFPKMGSTSLQWFFACAGLRSQKLQEGTCFRRAAERGQPVLKTCAYQKFWKGQSVEAWTQMDTNFPPKHCHYPQMSNLPQIHDEAPNATFVLNFRPFADWYRSLNNFHHIRERIMACHLPGLPKGKGRWKDIKQWLCGHVQNLRNFVQQYPTHELIELDLYGRDTPKIMASLFHTNESCWGTKNENKKLAQLLQEKQQQQQQQQQRATNHGANNVSSTAAPISAFGDIDDDDDKDKDNDERIK